MIDLDKLNKKILYNISENARESHNLLARKLKISREVLDYRLKKLQKQGIITGYQARINISNFIYGGYIYLIQSIKLSKEKEELILSKIKGNAKTQYIGKMGGNFDIIIGFTVKTLQELAEYDNFIQTNFGVHKSNSALLTILTELKDSYKSIFSEEDELNTIVSMPKIDNKQKLDEIDKNIIIALGKDCTTPSWKISKRSGMTEVGIRKRIKKLFENKVILGYRTMIDLTKLGYQVNNLFLKTNFKDADNEKKLNSFLQKNKRITYAIRLVGEYQYIFTFLSKDNYDLSELISNLRDNFNIIEVNTNPLFKIIYHTQLAKDFLF